MASSQTRAARSSKGKNIGGISDEVHSQLMELKLQGGFSSLNDTLADILRGLKGRRKYSKGSQEPPPKKRRRKEGSKERKTTTFLHSGWTFEHIASLPQYLKAVTGCDVEVARAMLELLQSEVFFSPFLSLPALTS
jgi:hypothetical protein